MNNKIKHITKLCIWLILVGIVSYVIIYQHNTIKALESANTSLQTHCNNLEATNIELICANEELNNTIIDMQNNIIDNKCDEILTFQSIIEQLKEMDKETWFILYKSIQEEYDDYIDPPESIYDYFTDEQIVMMQKCVETETYQCSFEAKINVACVILNRVEHDEYPTDPVEIITSKNQFAYSRNNITEDTILALEYAFMIEDTTDGCIAFRSDCSPDTWYNWTKQFTDECGHTFYK